MTNQTNHQKISASASCISHGKLIQYMEDRLKHTDKRQVEEHLIDCPLCSDALEGLSGISNKNTITAAVNEINARVQQQTADKSFIPLLEFKWKTAVLLSSVAVLGALGYYFGSNRIAPEENKSAQKDDIPVSEQQEIIASFNSDKEMVEPAAVRESVIPASKETKGANDDKTGTHHTDGKPAAMQKPVKSSVTEITGVKSNSEKTQTEEAKASEDNASSAQPQSNSSGEDAADKKSDSQFYLAYGNKPVENKNTAVLNANPEFPGGQEKLNEFIKNNLKYPAAAKEKNLHGTVKVGFLIKPDGTITDVKVIKSVSKELDDEAVRLVKAMPKWNPAKYQGENVEVNYSLGVLF